MKKIAYSWCLTLALMLLTATAAARAEPKTAPW